MAAHIAAAGAQGMIRPPGAARMRIGWMLVGLLMLVGAVYAPVAGFDFVSYDDGVYVYANPPVREGLSRSGVRWALTTRHAANWHPLTWLSHMLDVSLLGTAPGRHHLSSLAWHLVNALLVFMALRGLTGRGRLALLVAAAFALHPLQVESVAWVAQRKSLVSTMFWLLTLWAYGVYARRPGLRSYSLVVCGLCAGLMAKPMAVTLPCVLLLMDAWPLGRWVKVPKGRLVAEKLPLLLPVAVACSLTLWAQQGGGALRPLAEYPLATRLGHAVTAYAAYLQKAFWPFSLAVHYPHPGPPGTAVLAGAVALLTAITALALGLRRRAPYLLIGWLWFVGTLVPVIGLVQVGTQAMADRYFYVPCLGLFTAVVWGGAALARRGRTAARGLALAAVVVLACSALRTARHLPVWTNSETLYRHALAVTAANDLAHNNLGMVLLDRGETAAAATHFRAALTIRPLYAQAANNLGITLLADGRAAAAVAQLQQVLKRHPAYRDARFNLALALTAAGRTEAAQRQYTQLLERAPDDAGAHNNLAALYMQQENWPAAANHYRRALVLKPGAADVLSNLGVALWQQGRAEAALDVFKQAVRRDPASVTALHNLARIQLALGDRQGAAAHLARALRLAPQRRDLQRTLEAMRVPKAGANANKDSTL